MNSEGNNGVINHAACSRRFELCIFISMGYTCPIPQQLMLSKHLLSIFIWFPPHPFPCFHPILLFQKFPDLSTIFDYNSFQFFSNSPPKSVPSFSLFHAFIECVLKLGKTIHCSLFELRAQSSNFSEYKDLIAKLNLKNVNKTSKVFLSETSRDITMEIKLLVPEIKLCWGQDLPEIIENYF